jgi:predicted dehydrogenase
MIRTHLQWLGARDIVRSGRIGEAGSITGYFSFFMMIRQTFRQVKARGGGGILDIGCYLGTPRE